MAIALDQIDWKLEFRHTQHDVDRMYKTLRKKTLESQNTCIPKRVLSSQPKRRAPGLTTEDAKSIPKKHCCHEDGMNVLLQKKSQYKMNQVAGKDLIPYSTYPDIYCELNAQNPNAVNALMPQVRTDIASLVTFTTLMHNPCYTQTTIFR
ncbi:hypothetical protein CAPTEDRAFT_188704 [Capitella teleta]|uniref:Uncharacterized protein n=1 Tax=Capitella teleta TaxID=283909 RepID=R7T6L1_CAPTE|nr:hypothetical protein CAPTEDRAFT_188704 [Capitella teleta]|eukprot:ELT88993.1 hypothetical protein CAPTEDRAFT_188704 [Capitella teleta]